MAGTADADTAIHLIRHSGDAATASIKFAKSRNGTIGSHTVVAACDVVGSISWHGCDGGDFIPRVAEIRGVVDGTPGTNDMPGRLEFYTTADGAQDPTLTMTINNQGEITMPKQPAFSGYPSSSQSNVTGDDSVVTVAFGSERFDIGSNFASNAFTAPVTGKYVLDMFLMYEGVASGHTYGAFHIITANKTYSSYFHPYNVFTSTAGVGNFSRSVVADMDADDTAYLSIQIGPAGQAQTADVNVNSHFSGALLA
jgi:hypothetical protein